MTNAFKSANVGKKYDPTITINGVALTNTNTLQLTMSSDLNAATAIVPPTASPVLKTELELTLHSSFDPTKIVASKFTVQFIDSKDAKNVKYLKVNTVDTTTKKMKVMFGGAKSGDYIIKIEHTDLGKVDTAAIGTFKVGSTLTSFTPKQGTVFGGTLITITGTNFGTRKTDNPVQIKMGEQSVDCLVEETKATQIKCRVDGSEFAQAKLTRALKDGTTAELIVFLKTSEEVPCTSCTFSLLAHGTTSTSPIVTAMTGLIDDTTIKITVTGKRFDTGTTSGVELYVGK